MSSLAQKAEPALEALLDYNEDRLFSELGMRLKAVQKDPANSSQFDLAPDKSIEALGLAEDIRAFGRKYFARVNAQVYSLVCGSDADETEERNKLMEAFGVGADAVGPALAALLVAQLGLAPAIAAVVAALAIRLFFKPAHEAMCETWKEKLA
jgi:hypothetical protein